MACSRPSDLFWTVVALLVFAFYALCAQASPLTPFHSLPLPALIPRASPVVTSNPLNGSTEILDPSTKQPIPQGPGTDGSGSGFSPPAVLWIMYCVVVGCPLLVAGIRGWRFTTGAAVGLATGVCAWSAFINTVSGTGIPDLPLTLIVLGSILAGSIFGALPFMRVGGITVLGILGGLAAAMRIIVVKDNLLISSPSAFSVNWLLIAGAGVVSGGLTTWKQRMGIVGVSPPWRQYYAHWRTTVRSLQVVCAASVGSFLVALALDLALHKQDGLSRALRFLFDRNSAHLAVRA
ncbi:hypothetical protein EWM64_g2655 [Hericium alpestre]|uniref:TM7S3/TM198-like domain-containing protein n=1 Tax=Hericium alpestre TaxID=135208 RepID=A0A4Z0A4H3_9AGAM|nr:hypothetical protein EWM64_g2655 [Hericium alpestre]